MVGASRKLLRGTPLVVDHIDPIAQFRENNHLVVAWTVARAEEMAFQLADHVMIVYQEEMARVMRHTESVTETHLGVEYELFANPSADVIEHARGILSGRVRADAPRLVYAGGLEPIYNISTMLKAMDYLPDWELLVLGDGSLREQVASAEATNIYYLGTVDHELVPGFLHESTVGISLVDDPHTLKLLEYGAAGLPAVSAAGAAEARFGGLVEFTQVEAHAVATAVEEAAAQGPTDQFQAYVKQFRWESIAEQYENVCFETCGCAEPNEIS
jgi:glycosyltransferase involved in cell wall biosynthesis